MPVLESALTLIDNGRLYYRGQDALELAVSHSLEDVAALLWTGDMDSARDLFGSEDAGLSPRCERALPLLEELSPLERFQAILPIAAADDLSAYDLRPAAVMQTGAKILRLLVKVAAGAYRLSSAESLQRGWCSNDTESARLLNAAMVVCADHELNVSSFTARVVASAGSSPYAVVSAGLAALQGAKHGGYTERVTAFLNEVGTPGRTSGVLADRLRRGETLPGFGHRLYPEGDPRARLLVELVTARYPDSPALALSKAVAGALNLPRGGALALFALGRTVGWIGHALESYAEDRLIRPRARYTGRRPDDG